MPADERKRSTTMDRQNFINFLVKDASKPEDRGTVLTKWVERCSAGVEETGNVQNCCGYQRVRSWDGPTKSFRGAFLNAPTSGIAQLRDGDTKVLRQKQLTGIRTFGGCEWILSGKIGGR